MSIKITAPQPIDGVQVYGPNHIHFTGGVAVVQTPPWPVECYMREAGYQLEVDDLTEAPEPEGRDDGGVVLNPPAVEQIGEATEEPRVEVTPEPNTGHLVLVGETGPELVEMPKAGRVIRAPRKPKSE